jgi:hypothetical protein
VSGLERNRDGVLRLQSELKGHASGRLTCPSQLIHRLEVENCSVCDVLVDFTATPRTPLVTYASATPWSDRLDLAGSSKPRHLQSDWREEQMDVHRLPTPSQAQHRRDLDVTTTFRSRFPGALGPPQLSVSVQHRLVLQ